MATPTLVQSVMTGQDASGHIGGVVNSTLQIFFPNVTLANNLLVVAFQYTDTLTLTSVKDDTNTSWTAGPTLDNTTTGDAAALYYRAGAPAGVQWVKVQFTGVSSFIGGHFSEWYNVATSTPGDGSVGTADVTKSAGHYTLGSYSPATTGDLILCYGFGFGGGSGTLSKITAGTAGSGFTLMGADIQSSGNPNGQLAEYQVWSSSGSITTDFTTAGNTTATYGGLSMAFKNASAGTAPTLSPRIVAMQHQWLGTAPASTLQFPCPNSANLLVGLLNDDNVFITALTDSKSNSWSFPASAKADNSANGTTAQVIYAANATCGPDLDTMAYTFSASAVGNPFVVLYAVTGAATSPFDLAATSTGTQSSHGDLTTTSITPTTSGGIVFCNLAVSFNDVQTVSVSGQTAFFDSVIDDTLDNNTGTGGTPPSALDEDNGNAHVYNTNTSTETFVWTANTLVANPGMGGWASAAAAFKAGVVGIPIWPYSA